LKKVTIFADGSCLGNPGAGGWAAILRYNDAEKVISGGAGHTTNNQMELIAVIEALKLLKEPCEVELVSDSQYVGKAINEWLVGWEKKGFAKIKNPQLWMEYWNLSRIHKVKARWVRGHSGHIENERCDEIARAEAQKFKDGL
jgi:ribonuclease HI